MKKNQEVLSDKNKAGKEYPWKELKIKSEYLAYIFKNLKQSNKSFKVSCCGDFLTFVKANNGNWQGLKLIKAQFCKHRLCPMCNKRKAMKHAIETKKIIDVAKEREPKAQFLFLTLTAKNVFGAKELNKSIKELHKAFNKLIKRKKIKVNLLGGLRITEVTVNKKDGSYNQHLHVLLMIKFNYFNYSSNYISHAEWTSMWQESLKIDYTPIVNIKKVRPHKARAKNKNDLISAVHEVSKYSVKDSDYLTGCIDDDEKIVFDLDFGLINKHLISHLGIFKSIKKELGLTDIESENANLIDVNDDENSDEITNEIVFAWNTYLKNYYKN